MEFAKRGHEDSAGAICARVASVAGTTLRLAVYSVLAMLEPLVVWIAAGVTIVCLALCVFFGVVAQAPHFPVGMVLLLAAGSGLALVVYYALMGLLLPE